jgi:hypothetical protein
MAQLYLQETLSRLKILHILVLFDHLLRYAQALLNGNPEANIVKTQLLQKKLGQQTQEDFRRKASELARLWAKIGGPNPSVGPLVNEALDLAKHFPVTGEILTKIGVYADGIKRAVEIANSEGVITLANNLASYCIDIAVEIACNETEVVDESGRPVAILTAQGLVPTQTFTRDIS